MTPSDMNPASPREADPAVFDLRPEPGPGRSFRVWHLLLPVLAALLLFWILRHRGRPWTGEEILDSVFRIGLGLLVAMAVALDAPVALRNGGDRLILEPGGRRLPVLGRFVTGAAVPWDRVKVSWRLGSLRLKAGTWGRRVDLGRGPRAEAALSWLSRQGGRNLPDPR